FSARHGGLPVAQEIGLVEVGQRGQGDVETFEAKRRFAQGGHEFFVGEDGVSGDGAFAAWLGDVVAAVVGFVGGCGDGHWENLLVRERGRRRRRPYESINVVSVSQTSGNRCHRGRRGSGRVSRR